MKLKSRVAVFAFGIFVFLYGVTMFQKYGALFLTRIASGYLCFLS
jgi:hypothetical protein